MKLDITEAKTVLGFEPRVNLKEGTKAMVGWFSGKSPSGRI
jgi:nucleoside-diphosphate-sugar epimerase